MKHIYDILDSRYEDIMGCQEAFWQTSIADALGESADEEVDSFFIELITDFCAFNYFSLIREWSYEVVSCWQTVKSILLDTSFNSRLTEECINAKCEEVDDMFWDYKAEISEKATGLTTRKLYSTKVQYNKVMGAVAEEFYDMDERNSSSLHSGLASVCCDLTSLMLLASSGEDRFGYPTIVPLKGDLEALEGMMNGAGAHYLYIRMYVMAFFAVRYSSIQLSVTEDDDSGKGVSTMLSLFSNGLSGSNNEMISESMIKPYLFHFVIPGCYGELYQSNHEGHVVNSVVVDTAAALSRIQYKTEEPRETRLPNNKIISSVKELISLVGLHNVKREIIRLINVYRIAVLRSQRGFTSPDINKHLVFYGNPGTGKTTVARCLGQAFKELGLLSSGHVVEVDRGDLVGQYIGHTAAKTLKQLRLAEGGILFIDEAYTLSSQLHRGSRDFGQESIDTIVKFMEDHRSNIIIIVAGYRDEMESFIKSNPGLESRFSTYVEFEDYSSNELFRIFRNMAIEAGYGVDYQSLYAFKQYFDYVVAKKTKSFGNARAVRNILQACIENHADRLIRHNLDSDYDLTTLLAQDLPSDHR